MIPVYIFYLDRLNDVGTSPKEADGTGKLNRPYLLDFSNQAMDEGQAPKRAGTINVVL